MWTCEGGICSWCGSSSILSQHTTIFKCFYSASPCNAIIGQGLAFAAIAAVCNGSFAVLAKSSAVRRAQVPSYIFNLWLCLGILLASAPIAYGTRLRCVSLQGLLSGLLFVLSAAASVQSVQAIGVFQATGLWCGTAALVSFGFGVVVESSIISLPLAFAGVSCLLTGICLVAWAGELQHGIAASSGLPTTSSSTRAALPHQQQPQPNASATADSPLSTSAAALQQPLLLGSGTDEATADGRQAAPLTGRHPKYSVAAGRLCAVVAGVFGGLILAPMDFVGRECRGLPYLVGLAAGVLPAAPLVTYCLHWSHTGKVQWSLPLQATAAGVPGVIAGVIWAAGAASCMLSAAVIGLGIAYPIMQAGLFVGGLWGMLLYGELYSLRPHLLYWNGGFLLLGGVFLMSRAATAGQL